MLSTEYAADLFINIIYQRILKGGYKDCVTKLLPEGFPGRSEDPAILKAWFDNLGVENRVFVQEIIKLTIIETIFHFLVIFDNRVGNPVEGVRSEFAIYLQTYLNVKDRRENRPQESVRLNWGNFPGYEDLELKFLSRMREEEKIE